MKKVLNLYLNQFKDDIDKVINKIAKEDIAAMSSIRWEDLT